MSARKLPQQPPRQPHEPCAQQRQPYLASQQHLQPVPRTLINFSGSVVPNSAPFTVASSPLTVLYSFKYCAADHAAAARRGGRSDGK
jgi:hypothetical protein